MDGIEIHRSTPDDAATLEDIHDRCFRDTYARQLSAGELVAPDRAGTRQQLHGWLQPGSGFDTSVAMMNRVPVAYVVTAEHQLVHLFVNPSHQRTGIGRHLLALGESAISAAGYPELELHARVDNVRAIAFYEKAGWTVTERIIHTVEHGIRYDERILVKQAHQLEREGLICNAEIE